MFLFPWDGGEGVHMLEQRCKHCGKLNPQDDYYCLACGNLLPKGEASVATRFLEQGRKSRPCMRWGTAFFSDQMILRFHIPSANRLVEARIGDECILGRAMPGAPVDVDLSPYEAHEHGVSRRHVKLTYQNATVMVQDLGSANGTFLNGMRLVPFQPRVLRDSDELWLGRLKLRVSFKRVPEVSRAARPVKVQVSSQAAPA